jgi:hypothetical protein
VHVFVVICLSVIVCGDIPAGTRHVKQSLGLSYMHDLYLQTDKADISEELVFNKYVTIIIISSSSSSRV